MPDRDRPLDDRGKHGAPKMGERLAKRHVKPDLMLSSPARRALETAQTFAKKLGCKRKDIAVDDHLYGAAADDLVNVLHRAATSSARLSASALKLPMSPSMWILQCVDCGPARREGFA